MTAWGALVGGAFGTAWILLVLALPGPKTITIVPQFPGALFVVPLVWGAVIGAMSGGAFGVLLALAERGRGIGELRPYRVALWAAGASAAASRLGGGSWTLVALGSTLGAGIGAAATLLAKRGAEADTAEAVHAPPP